MTRLRLGLAIIAVATAIASCAVETFTYTDDAGSSVVSPPSNDAAGPLVNADGGADTSLEPIPPDASPATDGGRVTTGLIALYTFKETQGATINDVADSGAPLNLTITDPLGLPKNAKFTAAGLVIDKQTVLLGPNGNNGGAAKIAARCELSNAITVEAWITPSQVGPGNNASRVIGIATTAQGPASFSIRAEATSYVAYFNSQAVVSLANAVTTQLTHLVFTRDVQGVPTLYVNATQQNKGIKTSEFKDWRADDRVTIANSTDYALDWLGTLRLVAFYDRALSASEVESNFKAK